MDSLQDRFSALPDSLIHYILSFLRTVDVVKTCVLSTRWRYLWTTMPHLNFLDCDFYNEDYNSNSDEDEDVEVANKARMEAFGRFVDMVLQHRDAGAYLQSLRICWDFFADMRRVCRWVEYAVERHVREADLAVSDYYDGMELPSALFTSPWLQVLRITFMCLDSPNIRLTVPEGATLRRLRTLHVTAIPRDTHDPHQVVALDRLLSGCPLLEDLRLEWCSYQFFVVSTEDLVELAVNHRGCTALETVHMRNCQKRVVRVNAPRLKWLALRGSPCGSVGFDITAPNLRCFYYTDCCNKCTLHNLAALADVSLCVKEVDLKMFWGLRHATTLALFCHHVKSVDVGRPYLHLPTFINLRTLILRTILDFHDIVYILQQSPQLDTLVLEHLEPSCGFRPREFKEEHWKITAPTSLMHCLTTVSIIRFKGTMNEYEFLKFLVANARALRNVHLAPDMTRFLYNHL